MPLNSCTSSSAIESPIPFDKYFLGKPPPQPPPLPSNPNPQYLLHHSHKTHTIHTAKSNLPPPAPRLLHHRWHALLLTGNPTTPPTKPNRTQPNPGSKFLTNWPPCESALRAWTAFPPRPQFDGNSVCGPQVETLTKGRTEGARVWRWRWRWQWTGLGSGEGHSHKWLLTLPPKSLSSEVALSTFILPPS